MTQLENLQILIERYNSDLDYYRSTRHNKTQLRTDFLDQLFSILGWQTPERNRERSIGLQLVTWNVGLVERIQKIFNY